MDELLDILDQEGNTTGKTALKSHAHRMGLFHATVHIWFYTKDGKVLLQKRGQNKDTYPLLWDVSVAGHVAAGETIETAALREVEEEIGLKIPANQLHKIGVYKSIQKHHEELIDSEFHHTFISELQVSFKELKKQINEVEALHLLPLNEFSIAINTKINSYVPHHKRYYQTVINEIKRKL